MVQNPGSSSDGGWEGFPNRRFSDSMGECRRLTSTRFRRGHNAGTINPPAARKHGYWTNDEFRADAKDWFASAKRHEGSWWTDWSEWLKGQEERTCHVTRSKRRLPSSILTTSFCRRLTPRALKVLNERYNSCTGEAEPFSKPSGAPFASGMLGKKQGAP